MGNRNTSRIHLGIAFVLGLMIGIFLPSSRNIPTAAPSEIVSESTTTSTNTEHTHTGIEVDHTLPIPSVAIELVPDSKDGYNLKMTTEHFTFTPEVVGQTPVPHTGHAHLYINNEKIARVYSHWYYIPSSMLTQKENYVMVTLNANDHSDWVYQGGHIGAVALITK